MKRKAESFMSKLLIDSVYNPLIIYLCENVDSIESSIYPLKNERYEYRVEKDNVHYVVKGEFVEEVMGGLLGIALKIN